MKALGYFALVVVLMWGCAESGDDGAPGGAGGDPGSAETPELAPRLPFVRVSYGHGNSGPRTIARGFLPVNADASRRRTGGVEVGTFAAWRRVLDG